MRTETDDGWTSKHGYTISYPVGEINISTEQNKC